MIRTTTLALAGLLALSGSAMAQDHGDHATPEGMPDGWLMRFDRASATADMADFQIMEPGWHVTTGRAGAGLFWQPDMAASGPFDLGATFYLFSPASHAEAFGLFIGGQQLGGEDQSYLYFLVRQTGEYLIKRREGAETENVVGWTAHEAIPEAPPGEEGPTQYDLGVRVAGDQVQFLVNGTAVHSVAAQELQTDGLVGLRINHMLNVHVESLTLSDPG